jgi:hypothetical protein
VGLSVQLLNVKLLVVHHVTGRLTKRYKHSLSTGPVPLYKGHRIIEFVLIGIFRVAQLA